jgi:hypothetical protein
VAVQDRFSKATAQGCGEGGRRGRTGDRPGPVHFHPRDRETSGLPLEAAPDGFDFGEFRHGRRQGGQSWTTPLSHSKARTTNGGTG